MQNKNRNNQVYTEGQQSGKTDYPIASLLKVGKENAISTKELVRLSGSNWYFMENDAGFHNRYY